MKKLLLFVSFVVFAAAAVSLPNALLPRPPAAAPVVDDYDPECSLSRLNNELIHARAVLHATEGMTFHIRSRVHAHLNALEYIGGQPLTPPPTEAALGSTVTPDEWWWLVNELEAAGGGSGSRPAPLGLECHMDRLLSHLNPPDGALGQFRRSRRNKGYRYNDLRLAGQLLATRGEFVATLGRIDNDVNHPTVDDEVAAADDALEDAVEGFDFAAAEHAHASLEHSLRIWHLQRLQVVAGVPAVDDGGNGGSGQGGY